MTAARDEAKVTPKMIEALQWLTQRGRDHFDSVDLWPLYADASDLRQHALRVVAWKRRSGAYMSAMKRAGLLEYHHSMFGHGSGHHRTVYGLTEKGRQVLADA